MEHRSQAREDIKAFYDNVYYKELPDAIRPSRHLKNLAKTLEIAPGTELLDVACGVGTWLAAAAERGAILAGVDVSGRAIETCQRHVPNGEFYCAPAEALPFEGARFDLISCLGSLEHFLEPNEALREMKRVSKPSARFVFSVPNADFLTRRLGLFKGTEQSTIREDVRTIPQWDHLFADAGLRVVRRWPDLHVLAWPWIRSRGWIHIAPRFAQALALTVWPLGWQYQVYYLCTLEHSNDVPGTL